MASAAAATADPETLRLEGNKAFNAKDYDRAIQKYNQSLLATSDEAALTDPEVKAATAKTYSNLAATCDELGQHHVAIWAAEQCTNYDPSWAKGWFKRGELAEKEYNLHAAIDFFGRAYRLDAKSISGPTDTKYFVKLDDCAKKLGWKVVVRRHGDYTLDTHSAAAMVYQERKQAPAVDQEQEQAPAINVWKRIVGHDSNAGFGALTVEKEKEWVHKMDNRPPSSEQWIGNGLIQWYRGMADLDIWVSGSKEEQQRKLLEVCPSDNNVTQPLLDAWAHTGGKYIIPFSVLEKEYQLAVMNDAITIEALALIKSSAGSTFERPIRAAPAIVTALYHSYHRKGMADPDPDQFCKSTPEEALQYCKAQLQHGDAGVKQLVALLYRGTLLFSIFTFQLGIDAKAYEHLKWAREFIELAQWEWHDHWFGPQAQRASCFRPSFQLAMLGHELALYNFLRGNTEKATHTGPYPLRGFLQLANKATGLVEACQKESKLHHDPRVHEESKIHDDVVEFKRQSFDVASWKKPTARIAELLAFALDDSLSDVSEIEIYELLKECGNVECGNVEEEDGILNAIIADHYYLAAESELLDAGNATMLWWKAAAKMCEAEVNELEDLRDAIGKAEIAQAYRADDIFGRCSNPHCGSQEQCPEEYMAKMVKNHYEDRPGTFPLPRLFIIPRCNAFALKIGGEIICENFSFGDHLIKTTVVDQAKITSLQIPNL